LDVLLFQADPRRTTINNHAYPAAMRLAPSGDAKQMSERISHKSITLLKI
jgi:hypothetical protein